MCQVVTAAFDASSTSYEMEMLPGICHLQTSIFDIPVYRNWQLGKSLTTMAKLHHNKEFMEMALARQLPHPPKQNTHYRRTVG